MFLYHYVKMYRSDRPYIIGDLICLLCTHTNILILVHSFYHHNIF